MVAAVVVWVLIGLMVAVCAQEITDGIIEFGRWLLLIAVWAVILLVLAAVVMWSVGIVFG